MAQARLEESLREALLEHSGSRLVQLCVQDHSNFAEPHIHYQAHTWRRGEETPRAHPWARLGFHGNDSVLGTLRAATMRVAGSDVRLHMHNDECQSTAKEFVELLWSTCHELTEAEAAALRIEDKAACPICLDALGAGDSLLCMPCDGGHVGHWECMQKWLGKASTCPCCRFELPASSSEQAKFEPLIEKTLAAVQQVILDGLDFSARAEAHPQHELASCSVCEEEESEEAMSSQPSEPAAAERKREPKAKAVGTPSTPAAKRERARIGWRWGFARSQLKRDDLGNAARGRG